MFHELQILAWTVVFGIVHLLISAQLATQQRGVKWNMSARDAQAAPLTGVAARMDRAFKNFLETFVFFVAAVLLVEARRKNTDLSLWGAALYFVARLVYVPLYAFGIPVARTLVWFLSIIGIVMVLAAVLI